MILEINGKLISKRHLKNNSDFSIDYKEDDKIKNLNQYNLTKKNFPKINNDNYLSNLTNYNADKDIKIKDNSIKNNNNRDISNDIVKEGKFLLYNGFKFITIEDYIKKATA